MTNFFSALVSTFATNFTILFFFQSDSISFSSDVVYNSTRIIRYSNRQNKFLSSTRLIQMDRPSNLPPKPLSEQMEHQKEYEKMVKAIQKKGQYF